jgi:hypothetical protein
VRRKRVRKQIITATRPSLASGEYIRSCSPVWATECGGRVPLLFRGRGLHYVAVTDRRLILFRAPRRRRPLSAQSMLIAKRHPTFTLEKARRFSPLLQLRVRDASGRQIALEFRPRDRKVGRELAALLSERRALPPGRPISE